MRQVKQQGNALLSIVVAVVVVAAGVGVFWHRQYVRDQLLVWNYTPSPAIAQIADSAGMSEKGRFYYYASHPTLDGSQHFNDECRRKEAGSAILGCYRNGRIYIYDVKDERLKGMKEVTAAHEMLHAVYERMSAAERKRINRLLEKEEQKIKDDEFIERMEYYRRHQPGEHHNELHSIIGTEFKNLEPELESYYKTYFDDRSKVVSLHAQYSDKFHELKNKAAALRTDLERLGSYIDEQSRRYNNSVATINREIAQFNDRARRGEFASQDDFTRQRQSLVARLQTTHNLREDINSRISEYEQKRAIHNSLVNESNSMQQALDSSLAPAPSL